MATLLLLVIETNGTLQAAERICASMCPGFLMDPFSLRSCTWIIIEQLDLAILLRILPCITSLGSARESGNYSYVLYLGLTLEARQVWLYRPSVWVTIAIVIGS